MRTGTLGFNQRLCPLCPALQARDGGRFPKQPRGACPRWREGRLRTRARASLEIAVLALFPYLVLLPGSSAMPELGRSRESSSLSRTLLCAFPSLSQDPPALGVLEHLQRPTRLPAATAQHPAVPIPPTPPHLSKTPRRRLRCHIWWGEGGYSIREFSRPYVLGAPSCASTQQHGPFPDHLGCCDKQRLEVPQTTRNHSHSMRKLCQLFKKARSFTPSVGGSGQRFLNSAERSDCELEEISPAQPMARRERGAREGEECMARRFPLCVSGFLASWTRVGRPSSV